MKISFYSSYNKTHSSDNVKQRLADAQAVIPIPLENKSWQVASIANDDRVSVFISEIRSNFYLTWKILRDKNKVCIWRGRPSSFFFPMMLAKVLKRKNILILESVGYELATKQYGKWTGRVYRRLENVAYKAAHIIASTIPSAIKHPELKPYKVFQKPVALYYVKPNFTVIKPYRNRARRVAFIGRLSREKGTKELLKIIQNCHSDTKFLIVGSGPKSEYVKQNVNGHQVEFIGHQKNEKIPMILNECAALVLPSNYEGLPRIAIESMACGTPVISKNVGALPDLLGKDRGVICKDIDIDYVLGTQPLARMSQKAASFVQKKYSHKEVQETWRQLLKEIEN